jgi:hypothetical protein
MNIELAQAAPSREVLVPLVRARADNPASVARIGGALPNRLAAQGS